MNFNYIWTDGTNSDFAAFSKCLEEYFNNLVGGEKNRKNFIPYNALCDIHDVLIAYYGSEAVACASLKKYNDTAAEVKRVYVKEEYRGNGISIVLMSMLEQRAKDIGYSMLILQTRDACTEAVGLYNAIGYSRIPNFSPYENMPLAICFGKKI